MTPTNQRPVLVTDFDGTLTEHDFYKLLRERLLPADVPDFWDAYRRGDLTHFEALQSFFAAARPGEEALRELLDDMNLEPRLAAGLTRLEQAGWTVIVVSNGCQWYIDQLLARAGVDLEVHANPGVIREGRLHMQWPEGTLYPSAETGISKAAVVSAFAREGRRVAFAGDSMPDLEAALLVPPDRRFARSQLAQALAERGEQFRPFARWLDIAEILADGAQS